MAKMASIHALGVTNLNDYMIGVENGIEQERKRVLEIVDNILAQDPEGLRIVPTVWTLGIIRKFIAEPEEDGK
jgi:hypothetical protein